MTIIKQHYSVRQSRYHRKAWWYLCSLFSEHGIEPVQTGSNWMYDFYEVVIDDTLLSRLWTRTIAKTGLDGIYNTRREEV